MRLDFLAAYQHVSKLIERPAAPRPSGEGSFASTLSSLQPNRTETSKTTEESTPQAAEQQEPADPASGADEKGPMASFRFPRPELRSPDTWERSAPQEPPAPVIEPGSGEQHGVKTPTVLSARRVASTQLHSLPREERISAVQQIVQDAAKKHGVDPALSLAVVSAESSFNPQAVSTDGHESKGLMQLLDSTGRELHEMGQYAHPYDPFDPNLNVDLGVNYLRRLHEIFSTETTLSNNERTVPAANSTALEKLAVAAFNAGEGRVASAQARAQRAGKDPSVYEQVAPYLPEITRTYVSRVMAMKEQFEPRFIG